MCKFRNLCDIREERIDGIGPWLWIARDSGAWDGPKGDWYGEHKETIGRIPQRRLAIQAGGCMGMYPRLLSQYFETVYTFEPDHLNFFCLSYNCQVENNFKFQGFLGDNRKLWDLNNQNRDNCGTHTINLQEDSTNRNIPMFRIDDFEFQNVDLIWLDIESSEMAALKGAEQTIQTWKPWIIAEHGLRVQEYLSLFDYENVGSTGPDTIFKPKG